MFNSPPKAGSLFSAVFDLVSIKFVNVCLAEPEKHLVVGVKLVCIYVVCVCVCVHVIQLLSLILSTLSGHTAGTQLVICSNTHRHARQALQTNMIQPVKMRGENRYKKRGLKARK